MATPRCFVVSCAIASMAIHHAAFETTACAQTATVTFDVGAEGWVGPSGSGGATTIPTTGGNPGANMRTIFNDFGITFSNSANAAFTGDYTTAATVTISIDIRVENLSFTGTQVSRPFLVELRDTTNPPAGYPWKSVWFLFGSVSLANSSAWRHFSVTFDPNSTTLPAGWGGYGAENAAGAPQLPAGVTFRDVLKGVDSMAFTTLQPGYFFGFTDHTMRIDNVSVTRVLPVIPADLNGDGAVNALDLAVLLSTWGACPPKGACAADLDGNGVIDARDLAALLSNWTV
jgi:hypothetical protein